MYVKQKNNACYHFINADSYPVTFSILLRVFVFQTVRLV